MKVMLIMQEGRFGGAGKMLYWLASEVHKAGHEAIVVAIQKCIDIELYSNGWKYIGLNNEKSSGFIQRNTVSVLKEFCSLQWCISMENPDMLISFCDHSFYPALCCAKLKHKPLVISERVDPYSNRSRSERIRRWLYRFADACVFQTQKAKEFYPASLQERSVVIPNPVKVFEKEAIWKDEDADKSIISLGRIDMVQKRLDILIEAFSIVLKQFADYKLMVYGDGGDVDVKKMKELIQRHGISEAVVMCGVTKKPNDALKKSKLFVITSDFEGIPNTVIEAMNVGIPVVATDCSPGGARLLLGDSEFGELVECGNSAAVAEAMMKSLKDRETAIQKATKGRKALEKFSAEIIAAEWISFLERVVGKR